MKTSAIPGLLFSEQTLADLLGALRARAVSRPDNPGLIAFWPGLDERRMAAACAELVRLGYPVRRVTIAGRQGCRSRSAWALTDNEPAPF
jgi:hypothetical protein